jgi:type II secretory ATPase GspE/PulE/Tfp pilus assembly ATPase PilB-like protein
MTNKNQIEEELEQDLKECLDFVLKKLDKQQNKNNKVKNNNEPIEEDFDTILKCVVHKDSGDIGIITDNSVLIKWDKDIVTALITNIEISITMLKEHLNN